MQSNGLKRKACFLAWAANFVAHIGGAIHRVTARAEWSASHSKAGHSIAWQCIAWQSIACFLAGSAGNRWPDRGRKVTSGADFNVGERNAKLPLSQPLRTSQGPTVQEAPKGKPGKVVNKSGEQRVAFSHRRREQSLRQLMEGHTRRIYVTGNALPKLERTGKVYCRI